MSGWIYGSELQPGDRIASSITNGMETYEAAVTTVDTGSSFTTYERTDGTHGGVSGDERIYVLRDEPTSPEDARRFTTLLAIAADSPLDLRRCDVYRVVEAAQDAGMTGFADWLVRERADLEDDIRTAQAEIAPTTDWASTAGPEHFAAAAKRVYEGE